MYGNIGDYGIIGDMHTAALVSKDGSIDYCSMPHIDSPTVFALLLDDEKGGFFRIRPEGEFRSEQRYLPETNILSCFFKAQDGEAELIDYMPIAASELFDKKEHSIHRCLKVSSGQVRFRLEFYPRPQYAVVTPEIVREGNLFKVQHKNEDFSLKADLKRYDVKENRKGGLEISFLLRRDEEAHFDFIYGEAEEKEEVSCNLEETERFWKEWLYSCTGERCSVFGPYSGMLNRSLLALKLLTFRPTGAIAAAATTSLPESIGAGRNWDYRFTWMRDASFTLKAMFNLGHVDEAGSFINWLHNTYRKNGSRNLQIMYSLAGEGDLKETILGHLKGFKGSRPVRVGNAAFSQKQWDIYGEVMDAALRLSDYAGRIDEGLWPFFREICELASKHWKAPDDGIWEVRNGPFHFVYSKVMCWVALDRGIKIARRYGFDAPLERWQKESEAIKKEVLEKGFNKDMNSFVQHYGSDELDSSLLLLPLMNFLPVHDSRVQGTIDNCRDRLMRNGFLMRYSCLDGLEGGEGGFLLCNFWLIECLVLSGKTDDAERLLAVTSKAANHLGLFSEEYDFNTNEMLGNFPQAFSHIGYINAVSGILRARSRDFQVKKPQTSLLKRIRRLVPSRAALNESETEYRNVTDGLAIDLKVLLNNLQGAFFNVSEGRVDYMAMRQSDSYKRYLELAKKLNGFDPFTLKKDDEKKAFWINIYNILIIHGVIELDIRRSVMEVVSFFNRIGYNIGDLYFTPDDIEHGIIRANRPNPGMNKKQFRSNDPRRRLAIKIFDPRVHFALVCASSSCPPISFYNQEDIERQLELSARSFINRKGVVLDKKGRVIYLSQIFKWYGKDFGRDRRAVIDYISRFTQPSAREYIKAEERALRVRYLPYDWNLNAPLA